MSHPRSEFYLELERIKRNNEQTVYPFDSVAIWHLTQALGLVMSEASEDMWRATWMGNWENDAPQLASKGEIIHADTMNGLAALLGHWAKYHYDANGEYYMPYIPGGEQ